MKIFAEFPNGEFVVSMDVYEDRLFVLTNKRICKIGGDGSIIGISSIYLTKS